MTGLWICTACIDVDHVSASLVSNLVYAFNIANSCTKVLQLSAEVEYGSLFSLADSLHDRYCILHIKPFADIVPEYSGVELRFLSLVSTFWTRSHLQRT